MATYPKGTHVKYALHYGVFKCSARSVHIYVHSYGKATKSHTRTRAQTYKRTHAHAYECMYVRSHKWNTCTHARKHTQTHNTHSTRTHARTQTRARTHARKYSRTYVQQQSVGQTILTKDRAFNESDNTAIWLLAFHTSVGRIIPVLPLTPPPPPPGVCVCVCAFAARSGD